jgi:hypothetical protein
MRLIFKVQGAKDLIGTELNQDGGSKVKFCRVMEYNGLCEIEAIST